MGLDFAELISRVETDLSVSFEQRELEQARTVGDLYHLVLAKKNITARSGGACAMTAVAFFRLRSLLARELKVSRRQIRPLAGIAPHLPVIARRDVWRRLQTRSKLQIPALRRHAGLSTLLLLFCVAVALIPITDSAFSLLTLWDATWLGLLGTGFWWLLQRVAPVADVALPQGVVTFGDLAKAVRSLNYSQLLDEFGQDQQSEIWSRLAFLVADQLATDARQIAPEMHLPPHAAVIQSSRG